MEQRYWLDELNELRERNERSSKQLGGLSLNEKT